MHKFQPQASTEVDEAMQLLRHAPATTLDGKTEHERMAQLYKAMVGEEMPEGFSEHEAGYYRFG
ncbi:hypothetical protein [Kalamiella sp. sgz302252]|uniref:hypothetical protein n=1 Tax=Pantoea sp. sgz302252 TaxID=3341827 RepID=UPI0036D2E450